MNEKMNIIDVITNLKSFEGWEFKKYGLSKEEADAIIEMFEGLKLEDEIRITNCKLDSIIAAVNNVQKDLRSLHNEEVSGDTIK